MTKNLPSARTSEILVQEAGNELLIYDLRINKAFCLNETSRLVWQWCDGNNSTTDISNLAGEKLQTSVAEELVWLTLDQFKRNNLLEKGAEFEIEFGGLNRRELVRKVGLASIIALPLISSVVAPSAAMAQSGATNLSLLSPCTGNLQCQSGFCSPLTIGGTVCCTGSGNKLSPGNILGPATVCSDPTFTSQCCIGSGLIVPAPPGGINPVPILNCVCG